MRPGGAAALAPKKYGIEWAFLLECFGALEKLEGPIARAYCSENRGAAAQS
jgi:hypothetical protein